MQPGGQPDMSALLAQAQQMQQQLMAAQESLATSSVTVRHWRRGHRTVHHLIDPATGLPVVPGPDMVLTPTSEPAPVPPGTAEAPAAEPPPPDLPPVGPIQFEDLSKLVGQWVKLKTYNGRTWQGQVKAVKGNEVQLTVTQRSGAALMTLKKNAIASLERI